MVKLKQKLKLINIRTWILAAAAAGILAGTLIFLLREDDGKSRGNDGGDFISMLLDKLYSGKAEEYLKYYEPYVETAGEIYKDGDVSISMQYALCGDMVFVKRTIKSKKKMYAVANNWGFEIDEDGHSTGGEKYDYWFNDITGRSCTGDNGGNEVNETKKGIEELTVRYIDPDYEGEVRYAMSLGDSITEIPLKSGPYTRICIKREGGELIFTPHQLYWSGEIERNFTEVEILYKDSVKVNLTKGDGYTGEGHIEGVQYWYKKSSERMSTENVEKIFIDGVEAEFEVKER